MRSVGTDDDGLPRECVPHTLPRRLYVRFATGGPAREPCLYHNGRETDRGHDCPRSPIFLDDRFTFALRNATVVSVQSWPRHLGDSHPAAVHNVT